MTRPLAARLALAGWFLLSVVGVLRGHAAHAQPQAAASIAESVPGQFLQVSEPITSETVSQVGAAARQFIERHTARGTRPVIIFEFRSGESQPGSSGFGASYELARLISQGLEGASTVAYVPRPLNGYAVLAALSCDDLVLGSEASVGPITPDGQPVDRALRDPVQVLAVRKGRDPMLMLGMLDRDAELRAVRTPDKQLHFVLAENLADFRARHEVDEDQPAWDAGHRGVMTAKRARDQGFAKLLADTPAEVANYYKVRGQSSSADPTLGQTLRPVWIQIEGPIDATKRLYLSRRIEQARQEKVNLVFFQFNSQGGIDTAADAMADMIANIKDMKTVAYIDDRALGVATLPALACNEIVFKKSAQMGDVHQLVTGRNGQVQELDERQTQSLARRAANLAEQKGHSPALARAMVDPAVVLVEAQDAKTASQSFVLQADLRAQPGRFLNPEVRKEAGHVLTLTGNEATTYGLGQVVGDVEDMKALYGLRGKPIRVDGPTWVDSLVTVLTDPFVSWLLLFIGLFMLVLELKLPGIGLPAIASALAFLLFFWSHYLSGTADQLEIILFLIGMVCLALELFVFPGFGVFGMSGVLLILTSIVMASHTFVWPSQDYEYREMGYTLIRVTVAMAAVGCGAVVLARYFPSLPLFNRLVLKPEPWTRVDEYDPSQKPSMESYDSLTFLIGETGRTTTVLRPSGKARFGEMLIDVRADGFFIEPDSLVEVVDVQGQQVIVKPMGA